MCGSPSQSPDFRSHRGLRPDPLRGRAARGGRPHRRACGKRHSPVRLELCVANSITNGTPSRRRRTEGASDRAEAEASRSRRAALLELDQHHEPALPDQQAALRDPERQGQREGVPRRDDAPAGADPWRKGQCVRTLVSQGRRRPPAGEHPRPVLRGGRREGGRQDDGRIAWAGQGRTGRPGAPRRWNLLGQSLRTRIR